MALVLPPAGAGAASRRNVFFDVSAGGNPLGRIEFALRDGVVSRTAANFRALATGEKGYGYKGSVFHRVITRFSVQGGDITAHDGSGGRSVYGPYFDDENFALRHDRPGLLSMVGDGRPHTNSSKFAISTDPTPWLDGKQVVFGSVVRGMSIVKAIENFGSPSGRTSQRVVVDECGVV
ncbi:peptidylprolyl isomerase [Streptomyces sp. NPDC006645]|uniref:peptidylprolyl isomerase n=1 Tax=unclassified Streptomyces TaxID=2593676 RepID=UPI0033A4D70D